MAVDRTRAKICYARKQGLLRQAEVLQHSLDEVAVQRGWPAVRRLSTPDKVHGEIEALFGEPLVLDGQRLWTSGQVSAYFENGQIDLPYPAGDDAEAIRQRDLVDVLCNELWGWGKEGHDDGVMMLWFLMVLTRKYLRALDRRGGSPPDGWDEDGEQERETSPGRPAGSLATEQPDFATLEAIKAELQAQLAAAAAEEAR